MIVERVRIGVRTVTYRTRAPRSHGCDVRKAIKAAQHLSFVAASGFENACMNKDAAAAEMFRLRDTRNWLRKHGGYCRARIPRPKGVSR